MSVCSVEEVPAGEMRSFVVRGVELIVVRGHEACLVIPPSCPHMASPLAEGFFDGHVLTCSTHLWQWSVVDAQPIGDAEKPLLTYETRIGDGRIWVNLERELTYDYDDDAQA